MEGKSSPGKYSGRGTCTWRVARHEIIGIAVDRLYIHEVQGYTRRKKRSATCQRRISLRRDVSLARDFVG